MTKKPAFPLPDRPDVRLDANALELFARIVAAGSFAQAARQLGLTRAAISRRVAQIEAGLGQPLFVRSTRVLALSEAGRRLATRARAVAEAAAAARLGFRSAAPGDEAGAVGGLLRVTSVPTFGQAVLAPLLSRFMALHPALRLELSFTHRRIDLLREDVDVAFRITRRPPDDWVAREVLRFAVRAWAAPAAGGPLAHPADLATARSLLLGPPTERQATRWLDPQGGSAEVEIAPACVGDDMGTLVAMAEAGAGVVYAPDFSVQAAVAAGRLVDMLPGWRLHLPEGDAVLALTLPPPALPRAARALVQFVAAATAS